MMETASDGQRLNVPLSRGPQKLWIIGLVQNKKISDYRSGLIEAVVSSVTCSVAVLLLTYAWPNLKNSEALFEV